eukprot:2452571-Lingulodinium_polyedra.AAC.1
MLRIGEARHPGPFRLVSANVTSWGSAGKCMAKTGADLLCIQEARIRARDAEAAAGVARAHGYDLHL